MCYTTRYLNRYPNGITHSILGTTVSNYWSSKIISDNVSLCLVLPHQRETLFRRGYQAGVGLVVYKKYWSKGEKENKINVQQQKISDKAYQENCGLN